MSSYSISILKAFIFLFKGLIFKGSGHNFEWFFSCLGPSKSSCFGCCFHFGVRVLGWEWFLLNLVKYALLSLVGKVLFTLEFPPKWGGGPPTLHLRLKIDLDFFLGLNLIQHYLRFDFDFWVAVALQIDVDLRVGLTWELVSTWESGWLGSRVKLGVGFDLGVSWGR